MLQVFITELATQAIATLAVVVMELEKRLRVGGGVAGDACGCPVADDGVVLGRQLLPEVEGTVAEAAVRFVLAVGEEHGCESVDDEEADGGWREGFLRRLGGWRIERVVGAPVVAHMGEEQGCHLIEALGIEHTGEVESLLVVEHGELGDADVGEVLGTKPEELPDGWVDGCEGEFLPQVAVFLLQASVLIIVEVGFQQSCLSEEDGFNLEEVVAMLRHGMHRDGIRPLLEGITVDAEAETSGKSNEEGALPVPAQGLPALHDLSGTLAEAFQGEGGHPVVNLKRGEVSNNVTATGTAVIVAQRGVVVSDILGHDELQLWNLQPIGIVEGLVDVGCHMEDDVAIGGIGVVMVTEPVAGLLVDFHVAHPLGVTYLHLGIGEVRPCVGVVDARIENLHHPPVGGAEFVQRKNLVFPDVMQQLFHVFHLIFFQR